MGLTMEIPRVLSVGNVAVRIMHTRYDHLSPLSKSFYPRRKVKPPEVVVEEAPAVDETNGDEVNWHALTAVHLLTFSMRSHSERNLTFLVEVN